MTTNLKKLRPNKLTLEEMWQVYLYLKDGTPDPLLSSMMDNVQYMLQHLTSHRISLVLHIFYDLEHDQKIDDHLEFLALFIRGLRKNKYFEFVTYVRRLK